MNILKPNSIPDEYYLGDLPGTLQYKKTINELVNITFPEVVRCGEDAPTWMHEPCTIANRDSLLPYTKNPNEWILIMVISKYDSENDCIWTKGALMNKETKEIALMTACNSESAITKENRAIRSNTDGWFIGHYRMGAPLQFWIDLSNVCRQYM
jgi:hypothetical protein